MAEWKFVRGGVFTLLPKPNTKMQPQYQEGCLSIIKQPGTVNNFQFHDQSVLSNEFQGNMIHKARLLFKKHQKLKEVKISTHTCIYVRECVHSVCMWDVSSHVPVGTCTCRCSCRRHRRIAYVFYNQSPLCSFENERSVSSYEQ